jgi:hypothetical protein
MEDLLTSITFGAIESFGMYLTVVASYLVVAYLAGKRLTTLQTFIISVLFTVGATLVTFTAVTYMGRAIPVADALELIHPDRRYGAQPFVKNWLGVLLVLGIAASLLFMWQIRHSKEV